jgi:hypothetical protein
LLSKPALHSGGPQIDFAHRLADMVAMELLQAGVDRALIAI